MKTSQVTSSQAKSSQEIGQRDRTDIVKTDDKKNIMT